MAGLVDELKSKRSTVYVFKTLYFYLLFGSTLFFRFTELISVYKLSKLVVHLASFVMPRQVAWWEFAMEQLNKNENLSLDNFRGMEATEITEKWNQAVGKIFLDFLRESKIIMEEDFPRLK